MDIAVCTLGCKVNQYESAAMERELLARGHRLVPFDAPADAYIVNTCAVTAVSGKKSRGMVRRARRLSPGAVVAVCGCYAQTDSDAARELGADIVAGTGGRLAFLDLVERAVRERAAGSVPEARLAVDEVMTRRVFEPLSAGGLEGRTRAYLKVEDGCTNFCSYCIIPYARGPVRSYHLSDAAVQAAALADQGYKEIVLTGIELSSWGRDLKGGAALIDLIEAVCGAAPGLRVRLGSLEPRTITEDFCRRAAALPGLCPHFHLSLQSGCDETLRRMNRKYNTKRYLESVELLRGFFRNPAVTTDLIVGFPQETEEEFQRTLDFLRLCRFSSMHIFPFSRRPGTPAASMAGQVPRAVREERAHRAALAAGEMERAYLQGLVGTVQSVLFETEKDGAWQGHAPNYAAVRAQGISLHNEVRDVEITGTAGKALLGEILPRGGKVPKAF